MLTQACFVNKSKTDQLALIGQAFQASIGSEVNLSCITSDSQSRWYIYEAVGTFSESFASLTEDNIFGGDNSFEGATTFQSATFNNDSVFNGSAAFNEAVTFNSDVGFGESGTLSVQNINGGLYGNSITPSSPATGGTVNPDSYVVGGWDSQSYITPAGTIAALNVVLPNPANSAIGMIRRLFTSQTITSVTLTVSGGGAIKGTSLTTLAANTGAAYQYVDVAGLGTWARLY